MIKFMASIPPIQTAVKIGQDGMRIQLDVPEVWMKHAIPIVNMRNKVFYVTIEEENAQTYLDKDS